MSSYFKFSRNSLLVVNIDDGTKVQSRFCNRVAKLTGNRFGKKTQKEREKQTMLPHPKY